MNTLKNRIYQTTSIMYNLDNEIYDAHDINYLIKSGVNIFNVDRTIFGEDLFQKMKVVINASQNAHEMFPDKYYRPIGLAVTMTIKEFGNIDVDYVDLIILKDVKSLEDFLEFKKQNTDISVPIMVWIKTIDIIDLMEIIKFSDGIVLVDSNTVEDNCCKIKLCKQAFKPVFYAIEGLAKDYRALPIHDRKIFSIANKTVTNKFDGIILIDNTEKVRRETRRKLVRSLVTAIEILENTIKNDKDKLSSQIKIPVLPQKSAALSACLAAKLCGASAIIVLTSSGLSARWVASVEPPCHVLAITTRKNTARRLHLYRKVIPLFYSQNYTTNWHQDCWDRIRFGTTVAIDIGICHYDAKVVILAPSNEEIGYCNSLRIITMPLKCEDLAF